MSTILEQLHAAYGMPGGQEREQRITDLTVQVITRIVRVFNANQGGPRVHAVVLDWGEDGRRPVGFLDQDGSALEMDDELSSQLTTWTTNIHALGTDSAITRLGDGRIRLDIPQH